jgi:iron complex transport system substrate-binding protein
LSFSKYLAAAWLALTAPAAAHIRVVSLNLCTDQLLVLLAPEDIAALSPLARDPSLSFVAASAENLPWVRTDAEAVLALHPDLVLAETYGAQATVALLRARDVPVVQFQEPQDFPAIENQVRAVAGLLAVSSRGETMVSDMAARLAALPPPPRPRNAILWQARGYSAGPGSLGDAVLRAAGLSNAGNGAASGVETLAAHRPDLLVIETAPRFPSLSTEILAHPAVRGIARQVVAPALLACGGPFTVQAAEALAQ